MLEELFVPIEGYHGYEVSNYGRIITPRGFDLVQKVDELGRHKVNLSSLGKRRTFMVHQLVAQAFFVEWTPRCHVYHIHDDYDDNSVLNLTLNKDARIR